MMMSIIGQRSYPIAAFFAVAGLSLGGCGELYERTDFVNNVQGKSDVEVRKAVGKPSSIDASNPGRVTWTYTSDDPDLSKGNKRDAKTIVVFARGRGRQGGVAEMLYDQRPRGAVADGDAGR